MVPNIAPQVQVNFSYNTGSVAGSSARRDSSSTYLRGLRFDRTQRLDQVNVVMPATATTTAVYNLAYEYAPNQGRTRLKTVSAQLLDPNGAGMRDAPATTFEWSNETVTTAPTLAVANQPVPHINYKMRMHSYGDFNGDGKTDYLSASTGLLKVHASNGTGFDTGTNWFTVPIPYMTKLFTGDFNGDGKMDVLYGDPGFYTLYALKSTGTGFVGLDGGGAATLAADTWDIFKDPGTDVQLQEKRGDEGIGLASRITVADFDGDGRDDLLMHGYDGYVYLAKSTGTGFTTPQKSTSQGANWAGWSEWNWDHTFQGNHFPPNDYNIQAMPCDLNGDGLTDYAAVVSRHTSSFSPIKRFSVSREIECRFNLGNGDFGPIFGFDMPIATYAAAGEMADWLHFTWTVMPTDANNDGLTDFLVLGDNPVDQGLLQKTAHRRWTLYLNKGTGSAGNIWERTFGAIPNTITTGGESINTFYSAFVSSADTSLFDPGVFMDGSTLSRRQAGVKASGGQGLRLADMNGDGFADLVWYALTKPIPGGANNSQYTWITNAANQGWWVMYSTGGKPDANGAYFNNPTRLTVTGRTPASIWETATLSPTTGGGAMGFNEMEISQSMDLNGDGRQDWMCVQAYDGEAASFSGIALGQGTWGDLLLAVTDGLGRRTDVAYKAAKDDSVYTSGAAVSYPIREIRGSNPVVSDVWHDSGTGVAGDRSQFSYQYSGNRLDLAGRGGLGFHSFVTLDRQTNIFKYQFLAQSFPMTGLTHRDQTFRYWETGTAPSVATNFRTISSKDNTVVFDEVMNGATPWGTVYPFISKAIESRWEDGPGSHFTYTKTNQSGGPEAKPESLFPSYGASKPGGAHITISAESRFDNQTAAQLTIPGTTFKPSDTATNGANTVVGVTSFTSITSLGLPRKITFGNLKKLSTDYGDGFTETVDTAYLGVTSNGLSGLVDNVTTTVVSPVGGTEVGPVRRYQYWSNGATPTPLVRMETIDATDNRLDLTTETMRDPLGRVTNTFVHGFNSVGDPQHIGTYQASSVTAFDAKWDAPTTAQNALPYFHSTTTAYHSFLGKPISVTDVNNAQVTTQYDAMGRVIQQNDILKDLTTDQAFAWTTPSATDWKKNQTVTVPSGIVGLPGLTLTSVYAVRTTATVAPTATAYYDRLGRVIRTIKDGFNGQLTITDTIYNKLGQTVATSLPYLQSASPQILWTRTTYDPLGRVVTVTAPNGTVTTNTYKGRITQVSVDAANLGGVNPAAQINSTLVDAKGRTVSVWNDDNQPALALIVGSDVAATSSTTPSVAFALDGFGRMRTTTLKGQTQTITATYDAFGRQTSLNDPDKGNWTYVNNALGQVVTQTDARLNVTSATFDRLGRPLNRTTTGNGSTETADFYYYDTADTTTANATLHLVAKGTKGWIGAPEREDCSATGSFATTNLHYYDEKGRPSLQLARTDGKWFYTYSDYDAHSRVRQVRHYWKPSGAEAPGTQPYLWQDFGYTYAYDSKSYLTALTDSLGRSWWDSPEYDYLDRVTSVRKGGNLTTTRTYRPEDGVLTALNTGAGSIQNMSFGFDGLGNLTSRADTGVSETYGYDALNRLTTRNSGVIAAYQPNGNITSKTEVGGTPVTITAYDSARPHAVSQYTFNNQTINIGYDANGNLLTRSGGGSLWTMKWAGFDKPRWMAKTTGTTTVGSEFHYNAARSRVMQLEFDAMDGAGPTHYNRKRIYALGSTLELNYDNQASGSAQNWQLKKVRIYVPGPDGIIGSREFDPMELIPQQEKSYVYHYDHLGSIAVTTNYGAATIANDTGGKPGKFSEDAWGQRRNPFTWSGAPDPNTSDDGGANSVTPRGFTGHEMLDDLGLVHMNGRIYDPLLGRFLSADILVQAPGNLQAFNRYSYVFNNPLSLTDPSGFASDKPGQTESQKEAAELVRRVKELEKRDNVTIKVGLNKAGGLLFVVAQNPAKAAAETTTAVVGKMAPTPATDRVANQSPDSNSTGGTGSGTGKVDGDKQPSSEVNDEKEGTPPSSTPAPKSGGIDLRTPQQRTADESYARETGIARPTSNLWTGSIQYKQFAFVLGGGTFRGQVTGPDGRQGIVEGNIVSGGLQIGYFSGTVEATLIGSNSSPDMGTNGGFFSLQIEAGFGPITAIGIGWDGAAYAGKENADMGKSSWSWDRPGIDTDTDIWNPGGYLEMKKGIGGSASVNGFVVTKFTPIEL